MKHKEKYIEVAQIQICSVDWRVFLFWDLFFCLFRDRWSLEVCIIGCRKVGEKIISISNYLSTYLLSILTCLCGTLAQKAVP